MFGIDDAAMIGLGGSLISGGLNLFGQQKQSENQQQALQVAMQQYMLQKRQMEQQYELSTAGQTNARGDQVRYVPGKGWVTDLSPTSQSLLNESDAIAQRNARTELTTAADDKSRNFNRRLSEGSTANPLLDAIRYGYGAPSKEGVVGASKIADVTSATEGADQAKSGFTAAALRTGQGAVPLGTTMASADRGATSGVRTALAKGDANASPLYDSILQNWQKSKLDPYNMLATRASNPEGSGFTPENVTGSLDSTMGNRAVGAGATFGRGAASFAGAANPMIAALMAQKQPNYDTFAAGLTSNLQNLFKQRSIENMSPARSAAPLF